MIGVLVAAVSLAGCVSSSSSGSRHTLYDDIDDLARDSGAIVVGTVSDQWTAGDVTVSTVVVSNTADNPQLGGNVEGGATPMTEGDTVEVRQMNGLPASGALERGTEYLLFLTPSMLPGPDAEQFYITGAEAGLYKRDGSTFRRVVPDSGDELPETISIADAAG